MAIVVQSEGRPIRAPGSSKLIGEDGNVFSVIGRTAQLLRRAGASAAFIAAYRKEAASGSYDHALSASIAYLDAD